MADKKPIYVTQPYLPPFEEFVPLLKRVWDSRQLTNSGPFHAEFESELARHLGVEHVALFANATLALVTALQALRVGGEVITTPYSFVATSHSLLWNGIKPVFVDIDPQTLNINPALIEAAITPQTTAIMPVHCYGTPCDVRAIERIADTYNLKVIYDAAHAFGVVGTDGTSVLNHGDMSVLSFHATKVMNTFEGGAIICRDAKTKARLDHLKNFGFVDEVTVVAPGINGKMSEFNAALGLLQLQHIGHALEQRARIDAFYREQLADIPGLSCLPQFSAKRHNYAYFPVLVTPSFALTRDALFARLREHGIFARRYFYPLISDFPMYRHLPSAGAANLPVATRAAQQVICLPIYPDLSEQEQRHVIEVIRTAR